ncbi:DnaJ (Hsp40), sub C, member 2, partial [Perkinsus olseni]
YPVNPNCCKDFCCLLAYVIPRDLNDRRAEPLRVEKVRLNLYDILKVGPTATQDQIKKSYRRLVLEHHPDKKKGSAEEEEEKLIFLRIQEAFEVLSDERRRK